MAAGFTFELGVFVDGFVPSSGNAASWLEHWSPEHTTSYDFAEQRFSETYEVLDNEPPLEAGAKAWIFGHRDSPTGSEWILFRASDWLWPEVDVVFPNTYDWNAKDAREVVLGTIQPTGVPFLMQSALVRSYTQWQTLHLTGEPLFAPNQDPDLDGSSNLLEFVFGTDPKTANAPVATPVALQSGNAVITIPRRIDHLAVLTVEVSGNLTDWNAVTDPAHVLQDDASALVVRDPTALDAANPKRFIRLKATLP